MVIMAYGDIYQNIIMKGYTPLAGRELYAEISIWQVLCY